MGRFMAIKRTNNFDVRGFGISDDWKLTRIVTSENIVKIVLKNV